MNVGIMEQPPFRFSPLKHHLLWVCRTLAKLKRESGNGDFNQNFFSSVSDLNSNYIDVYTGELMPEEILKSIGEELLNLQISSREAFREWLDEQQFRVLTLTDDSVWVLREGIFENKFIHVHPARFTPYSVRLHGNSYKTALILNVLSAKPEDFNLSVVNQIRRDYLGLSPIKRIDAQDKINKALRVFETGLLRME